MRNMRLFKERFLIIWTKFLEFVNKVCLLITFFLIPTLLLYVILSICSGFYVTALIQAIILVLIIYVNKQL